MRCHNAKEWLVAQRDGNLDMLIAAELQEHIQQCGDCRTFQQKQRHIETVFCTKTPHVQTNISTDNIMHAIQQQRRVTQQLEDIRKQQQCRVERLRPIGTASAALGFFTLSCIPLLILAITLTQTDLVMKALSLISGVIGVFIILAHYLQMVLQLATRNNWLLSIVAFAVVIMMGMWLRLMRTPQEA